MKKHLLSALVILCVFAAKAQDDLLNMLDKENPQKPTPVYATFKSTRVVNLQSNETMKAKHLDFRIQHRFNSIQNGAYDMFGLDGAVMRLGFEYGLTDRLMLGVGRSTTGKSYDGFLKYQLLQQQQKGHPVSIGLFGSTAINTLEWQDPTRNNLFSSRLAYCAQVIFTRKFNEHFSMIVSPTMVHYNLVPDKATPNDIFAVGVGASVKITRSTRFNIEYIPRLNGRDQPKTFSGDPSYYDAVAFGFDIETGGHVFQLHFTNATGLIEQQFVARNSNAIAFKELRFGFNLSRTFSFDRSRKW
ncbi:MAG: DUF5777 family beta-barrel protein [Bacteroidota bacterium]